MYHHGTGSSSRSEKGKSWSTKVLHEYVNFPISAEQLFVAILNLRPVDVGHGKHATKTLHSSQSSVLQKMILSHLVN